MSNMSLLFQMNMILVALLVNTFTISTGWYKYGTNTPYQPGNLKAITTPEGCNVVHLDMVLRHGSRYLCDHFKEPMFKVVEEVNKVHQSKPFTYKNLTLPWKVPKEYILAGMCEKRREILSRVHS